jgi:hypothetical protein
MTASHRVPGSGSWERAQQLPPDFQPTVSWELEPGGGRWWRWPLAALSFLAVAAIGYLLVSLLASIARQTGTADTPIAVLVAVGLLITVVAGGFVALRVARPPLRWVPKERLMPVKSDQQRRLEAGAEGEFITGAFLKTLEPEGYLTRHSVEVPGEVRPIDHIVVGPTGLFVVESKYYVEDVHASIDGRLFGSDGTSLDAQMALLRHQCDEVWRQISGAAGISVRGVFSMVGHQTTPGFALDPTLWCVPGHELTMALRTWFPRRLEPELVRWLAERVDQVFGTTEAPVAATVPPLHRALEGTSCDRIGCGGARQLRTAGGAPLLICSNIDTTGCTGCWTLDGWPLEPD